MVRKSLTERFWGKVDKTTTPNGCWEWIGSRNVWNYGNCSIKGKRVGAHRFAWELTNGTIPKGLEVLHKCDNPPCCRPDHLFLGTQSDNINDSVSKGRQIGNTGNRKLTPEQAKECRNLIYVMNLTQRQLGIKYNVHQSTISRALSTKRRSQ